MERGAVPAAACRTKCLDRRVAAKIVTYRRLGWVIDSFAPYKSPGMDGIFPALLQEGREVLIHYLVSIFRTCLTSEYVPALWRQVNVVFIPKSGRNFYCGPRDFWPISITPFLLKTMERLVDRFLRDEILALKPLHLNQHAYQAGKVCGNGTPSARGTGWEGSWLAGESLRHLSWYRGVERLPTGRCFVTSPMMPCQWTVSKAQRGRCLFTSICGWHLPFTVGKFPNMVSGLIQWALHTVEVWCDDLCLSVNPDETCLVAFTRRRKLLGFSEPRLCGTTLHRSMSVTYLRVILDSRLTWSGTREC